MAEKMKGQKDKSSLERRSGTDRRTGKLDEKYQHSVRAGFFLDMRKGSRRKFALDESLISLN